MAKAILKVISAGIGVMLCLATPALCQDDTDGGDEDAGSSFSSLNAQADQAAEEGDFPAAIRLWREAIPYDRSPYVECRGALQRVYIRVAEHVVSMVNDGTLDDDAAFEWFKSRASNLWGNSACNSPG